MVIMNHNQAVRGNLILMTMTKKISSFFLLLICFAIFDNLIKNVTEFSVNLDVFYHCSIFAFILFWIRIQWKENRNKFDRKVLVILSLPFILRLGLNSLAINEDYKGYSKLVSNQYIDFITWLAIVILLLLVLWERFIVLRR